MGAQLQPSGEYSADPINYGFASPTHKRVCLWFGGTAVVGFVLFSIFGVMWHKGAPFWLKVVAAIFALLWAVGTPSWFSFERWRWGKQFADRSVDIDRQQDRIRDLWIGLGAVVLILADHIILD